MFKLGRHRGAQWTFALLALYCGLAFFILGSLGWSAMAPGQYGEMAVSFEIEAMAGVQLCGAMFVCIGLLINGRWRWSAAMRLVGTTIICVLLAGLGYSSAQAPNGWPFTVYLVGFIGFGLIVAWWNLVDLRAAISFWEAADGEAG